MNDENTITINGRTMPISGYKTINGQSVPVVKCTSRQITHPDGRVDVVVNVPTISAAGVPQR